MKKARVLALMMAAVMMMAVLTGCPFSKKEEGPTVEELQAINEAYVAQVTEQAEQLEALQQTLDKLTGKKDTPSGNIYNIETGEGRSFNSLGGSITLPVPYEYPGSEASPESNKVQLDAKYSIQPTENWTVVLGGTSSSFFHNSGITVKFQVAKIKERVQATDLREQVFDLVTAEIPCENAHYGSIFFNEYALGGTAAFTTVVDGQPAQMRLGAFGDSDRCITYVTLYEGDVDSTKEELVGKLLSSLTYGTQQLKFS